MVGIWIGIDVSWDRLDSWCGTAGSPRTVPTTARGHGFLLTTLRRLRVAGAIIASTGAYHQGIVTRLHQARVPVTPPVITCDRQSFGRTATTDAPDARLLARYGEMHQPDPSRALTPTERDLRAVLARREDLVVHLVAEKTRRTQGDPTSRLWPHLVEAIALSQTATGDD